MNLIRDIRLAALRAADAILDLFDSGLDGAIAAFQKADAALAKQNAKLQARIEREFEVQQASYDREAEARAAEVAARSASRDRVTALSAERQRAMRIQKRIASLLD